MAAEVEGEGADPVVLKDVPDEVEVLPVSIQLVDHHDGGSVGDPWRSLEGAPQFEAIRRIEPHWSGDRGRRRLAGRVVVIVPNGRRGIVVIGEQVAAFLGAAGQGEDE